MKRVFVGVLLAAAAMAAEARSAAAASAFRRHNPCPATSQVRGACPGYVIDHVIPLCAGGEDHPRNMQWQEHDASLQKDAQERRLCRALRRKN